MSWGDFCMRFAGNRRSVYVHLCTVYEYLPCVWDVPLEAGLKYSYPSPSRPQYNTPRGSTVSLHYAVISRLIIQKREAAPRKSISHFFFEHDILFHRLYIAYTRGRHVFLGRKKRRRCGWPEKNTCFPLQKRAKVAGRKEGGKTPKWLISFGFQP